LKRPKEKEKGEPGARAKLRDFFERNLGRVVESYELREAAGGITEWARRVRELRDEEGLQILTHRDRDNLKPGEYLLETTKRRPAFARTISQQTRALVLARNGFTCQWCGRAAGDPHPLDATRKVTLHIGHIREISQGGTDEMSNLRTLCSACNEGASIVAQAPESLAKALGIVRRATRDDQMAILKWLASKYPKEAKGLMPKD